MGKMCIFQDYHFMKIIDFTVKLETISSWKGAVNTRNLQIKQHGKNVHSIVTVTPTFHDFKDVTYMQSFST